MLPAKGYLKSINCPFFETCICERPYCHYKHNHNKNDIRMNSELISEIVSKAVHKVLQESNTGAGTGVGIGVGVGVVGVGVNAGVGTANNVTYNPTPISQLNKYKNESIIQIKKHIPIQYTPEQPRSFRNIQTNVSPSYMPSLIENPNTTKQEHIDVPYFDDEFIAEFLNDPDIYEDPPNQEPKTEIPSQSVDALNADEEDSEESTIQQCQRIFEEYKVPTPPTSPILKTAKIDSPPILITQKRVAYKKSGKTEKDKAKIRKTSIKNPAIVMADRYKKNNLKRLTETNDECPAKSKRIASVPNVSAILDAKKSIDSMIRNSNKSATPTGQSAFKVKRIAHVPEICFADVPTVRLADKSKLPVNIRSRFLFLIVKECVKLYVSKEAAYERALNEEFNCYSKCSAINSYKNTIMLLINRLRKEINGTENTLKSSNHHVFQFDESKLYDHLHKWILTDDELFENKFPRLGALRKGHAIFKSNKVIEKIPDNCQQCARCKKVFQINVNGYPVYQEDCVYHPYNRVLIKGEAKYSCCQQISLRKGCCVCSTHVFEITNPEKLTGFVSTFDPDPEIVDPRSGKIYALDCEMVYTTRGLELARVTVIDHKCEVCYETLVKPLGDILDCNTRFSGLTTDLLQNVNTKITDVQATLLLMFNSKTILVGHSFESDLKALRLIHSCVIDTSVMFPHKMGPPKKRALRTLASEFLKKLIQNDEKGHDSAEDAVTCMELLIWKLKEELKSK